MTMSFLHEKKPSDGTYFRMFSYQWFRSKTRFDIEAQGISKMAYSTSDVAMEDEFHFRFLISCMMTIKKCNVQYADT